MTQPVIEVNDVSKRYLLGEGSHGAFRYSALRDVVSSKVKSCLKRVYTKNPQATLSSSRPNELWALKDINFTIQQGEKVGIIGHNGAGKSTLLKVLSRITEPTTGQMKIIGRLASLLEVGTGFHPELTGRENIFLNGAVLGMPKVDIKRKFDEIVEFAGVEKFLDTPVKRYSSGMYVRLAFSVAAHLEPEILLIDEVLAVGDVAFQKKCLGKMNDVSRDGRTVLFVSHNISALHSLCDRGILLKKGQIVEDSDIQTAISQYIEAGNNESGEIIWQDKQSAPGNERCRLHAIRVLNEGKVGYEVDSAKEITLEVDYFNFEPDGRRRVSVHVTNSAGVLVFGSANFDSASPTPDPWFSKKYPVGLFRTRCVIPKCLLNDGVYSVSLFIGASTVDTLVRKKDVISFNARDYGVMKKDHTGEWAGVVRPLLDWKTEWLE